MIHITPNVASVMGYNLYPQEGTRRTENYILIA